MHESVKCHGTHDNANTRCLSDSIYAEVTGMQFLEIVFFASAGLEPADEKENCMRSATNKHEPAGNGPAGHLNEKPFIIKHVHCCRLEMLPHLDMFDAVSDSFRSAGQGPADHVHMHTEVHVLSRCTWRTYLLLLAGFTPAGIAGSFNVCISACGQFHDRCRTSRGSHL